MSTPDYPVRLVGGHELGRSRLTVFFRLILIIPHYIVLAFYGIGAFFAIFVSWFAALFTGRVPDGLHNFIAGYLRYYARVLSYQMMLANPYPPFGAGGEYPVDLEIDPAASQGRLGVFFRYFLAIPCLFVMYLLNILLNLIGLGGWIVGVITGRMPEGMESLGMFCLRFIARTQAYLFLVNPRYPAFGDTPGSLPASSASLPPLP